METTNGIPIELVVFFPPVVSFQALENSKAWASQEHDKLVNKLKMAIQEKDKTIGVSNEHQTTRPGISALNFLYCYTNDNTSQLFKQVFLFYFPAKGLVESGREKDKMLKALQVSSFIKISSLACSLLAFESNYVDDCIL